MRESRIWTACVDGEPGEGTEGTLAVVKRREVLFSARGLIDTGHMTQSQWGVETSCVFVLGHDSGQTRKKKKGSQVQTTLFEGGWG